MLDLPLEGGSIVREVHLDVATTGAEPKKLVGVKGASRPMSAPVAIDMSVG